MAISPKAVYDVAAKLCELAKGEGEVIGREALVRCAIGRYYYAAFLWARQEASRLSAGALRTQANHAEVWRWYAQQTSTHAQNAGALGEAFHAMRKSAEYDLAGTLRDTCADAVGYWEDVVAAVIAYRQDVASL